MIKFVRIDHRLLHGQVLFSWTKSQNIARIIVIDDEAATDDLKKMTMKLSKPADIKLSVFTIEQARERITKINGVSENTMVIFGNVATAAAITPLLSDVKAVNYGGIPKRPDTQKFSNFIFLTAPEVEQSRALKEAGLDLYMQQVPTSHRESLTALL
ncbi:PTS sugar transporter subunit IIB [Bombilactobacillus thymidiniphilus]|uniref:PTS sugar transporter subunit IIB n=1 Tax=Bombilactobacillus thymidiniphilus TaxID=2923363 RepID=A0ABY4PEH6_9LACO|nr:PTS sugar transporter subunit IIB [Bombilactobacillus thymidiniphilus]UQS84193.1 PTS sugar transporter subunit IIB [Bombilactobacillus thymidiniphilus]